ncbi:MAG: hypothetical protein HWQ36_30450 [Nostoc sp. NMS2]|nr:hypothetical protein [Nostoc sp. NMS2]
MILLFLWDGQHDRPLYFRAGRMPTPQESSLNSAMPNFLYLTWERSQW